MQQRTTTRDPRHGRNNRPDARYGADNETPGRNEPFDGTEYGWRGEQGGRGGDEAKLTEKMAADKPTDGNLDTFGTDSWPGGGDARDFVDAVNDDHARSKRKGPQRTN